MFRVLIADDDDALLDLLAMALEDQGYTVLTAGDGRAARDLLTEDPHIVISDVNMPHLDGFALCKHIRDVHPTLPVMLLTSRDSEIDEALGLDWGADDYVTKPFSTRVLLSRVGALLRRSQPEPEGELVILGALSVDHGRLHIRWNNALIETTVTEFRIVDALARRPGMVFTRERLLDEVRGDDSVVAIRIIDTYIRRLRRKLEAVDQGFNSIETVIGAGYRWREP